MSNPIPAQPWTGQEKFWDHIELDGKEVQGLATVSIKRANKVDKKSAKGSHGGDDESSGAEPAEVKIAIRFLTKVAWEAFAANVMPTIEPAPGKKKLKPVSLRHAVAAARNVTAIVVLEVDGPEIRNGQLEVEIKAKEHRPPDTTNAGGKVSGVGIKLSGSYDCAELLASYNREVSLFATQRGLAAGYANQLRAAGFIGNPEIEEKKREAELKAHAHEQKARLIKATMQSQNCPNAPP